VTASRAAAPLLRKWTRRMVPGYEGAQRGAASVTAAVNPVQGSMFYGGSDGTALHLGARRGCKRRKPPGRIEVARCHARKPLQGKPDEGIGGSGAGGPPPTLHVLESDGRGWRSDARSSRAGKFGLHVPRIGPLEAELRGRKIHAGRLREEGKGGRVEHVVSWAGYSPGDCA